MGDFRPIQINAGGIPNSKLGNCNPGKGHDLILNQCNVSMCVCAPRRKDGAHLKCVEVAVKQSHLRNLPEPRNPHWKRVPNAPRSGFAQSDPLLHGDLKTSRHLPRRFLVEDWGMNRKMCHISAKNNVVLRDIMGYYRRKSRSQTSDTMDRWKSRREEKKEDQRRERVKSEDRRCSCAKR